MVKKPFKPIISFLSAIGVMASQSAMILPANASYIDSSNNEWWSVSEILSHRDEWMNFINSPDCFLEGMDLTACRKNHQMELRFGDYGILSAYSILHDYYLLIPTVNYGTNTFQALYFGQPIYKLMEGAEPEDLDKLIIYSGADDSMSIEELHEYNPDGGWQVQYFYNSLPDSESEAWMPVGELAQFEFEVDINSNRMGNLPKFKYTIHGNPEEYLDQMSLDTCHVEPGGGECRLMINYAGYGSYNTKYLYFPTSEEPLELSREQFEFPTPEPEPTPEPDPVEPDPIDPVEPNHTEPEPTPTEPTEPEPTGPVIDPSDPEPTNPDPVDLEPIESDPVTPEPSEPIPAGDEPADIEPATDPVWTGYGADSETLSEIIPASSEEIIESSLASTLDEEEHSPVSVQSISYTSSYSVANESVAEAKTATLPETPKATPSKDEQKVNLASSEVEQKLTIPQEENAIFPWWLIALPISIGGVSAFWLIPNRKK